MIARCTSGSPAAPASSSPMTFTDRPARARTRSATASVGDSRRPAAASARWRQLGPQEPGRPDDAVCGRGDQPAVAGDVGDLAVVAGTTPPRRAGGPGELVVELVA